jgi:hypothetical protein
VPLEQRPDWGLHGDGVGLLRDLGTGDLGRKGLVN